MPFPTSVFRKRRELLIKKSIISPVYLAALTTRPVILMFTNWIPSHVAQFLLIQAHTHINWKGLFFRIFFRIFFIERKTNKQINRSNRLTPKFVHQLGKCGNRNVCCMLNVHLILTVSYFWSCCCAKCFRSKGPIYWRRILKSKWSFTHNLCVPQSVPSLIEIYMSYFASACKTEGKNGIFPPNFRNGIIWIAPFQLNICNGIIWGCAFPKHSGLQKHLFWYSLKCPSVW